MLRSLAATTPLRPVELELRDAIADCTSKFHALLCVASYWNPEIRLYVDTASRRALPQETAEAVGRLHTLVFEEWISLPLAHQLAEFTFYLQTLMPTARETLLRVMESMDARVALAPQCSREARDLFLLDLGTVLRMSAVPDPDEWPQAGRPGAGRDR